MSKVIRELIGDTVVDFFKDKDVKKEIRKYVPAFIGEGNIPALGGNGGKFLSTNGTILSWATVNTIYTGDGSLSGDRTIDLNGHQLFFTNGGNVFLALFPSDKSSTLGANDGTSVTSLHVAAATGDQVDFELFSSNGVNSVDIIGNPSTNSITYTADTHTVNGLLNLTIQAAPASPNDGDIWRQDNTNTGLKIRVNGVTKTITLS